MSKIQANPMDRFMQRSKALAETTSSVNVGERFQLTSSAKWHSGDVVGVHCFTFVVEVVGADSVGVELETVEVVSEVGRPPFKNHSSCPHSVSYSHLPFLEALGRGEIVRV